MKKFQMKIANTKISNWTSAPTTKEGLGEFMSYAKDCVCSLLHTYLLYLEDLKQFASVGNLQISKHCR